MAAKASPKPRGPLLRAALALLIIGGLLVVPAGVVTARRTVNAVNAPSVTIPGVTRRSLASGTWFIFERTGKSSGAGGFTITQDNAPTLQPAQVTVTGFDGRTLPVAQVTVDETITNSSRIYTAVLQFKVKAAGSYDIRFDPGQPGAALVTRPLGHTFRTLLGPLAIAVSGGLLLLVGLVLFVVGSKRRTPAAYAGATTPAGWYPDPGGSGGQRWWDGGRWTQHWP